MEDFEKPEPQNAKLGCLILIIGAIIFWGSIALALWLIGLYND